MEMLQVWFKRMSQGLLFNGNFLKGNGFSTSFKNYVQNIFFPHLVSSSSPLLFSYTVLIFFFPDEKLRRYAAFILLAGH